MKEFITAAREAGEDEDEKGNLEFAVDGRELVAYRPGDGQLAVLMASTGRNSDGQEQIAGIINFFASVLDDDARTYVVNKLLDRRDPFGVEEVTGIIEWMIEEWSARPTKSPSGSSRSQKSGGPKSKRSTPALT